MAHAPTPIPPSLDLPALHASHAGCWLREPGGATRVVGKGVGLSAAADTPLLLLGAPLVASRLGYPDLSGLDLLELFAFVHPARFMVPTPKGLAHALGLPEAATDEAVPGLLQQAAASLLASCEAPDWPEREGAWTALQSLARLRWPWAPLLARHIARPEGTERWLFSRLPEWQEAAEQTQPAPVTIGEEDVLARLAEITGEGAEPRPGQRAYAQAAAHIFAPREAPREARSHTHHQRPHILLAEAGTGTGKTAGYLAPASLWAQTSGGTVWVSTYTKALQRQLRRESARAFGTTGPEGKPAVVVRKGRENYLCLLNLEDALQGGAGPNGSGGGFGGRAAVLAHLVARWAGYTQDGDMIGGDLPGWLSTLFRARGIASLTDRRGECVFAGCPHYRKCFIERSARAAAEAQLVIGNHALVMVNAARAGPTSGPAPTRIIFDEGHHLFDAADSTFAVDLTGSEAIELRRWVMGPEKGSRGRRRGLAARLSDVASYDEDGARAIAAACEAAEALPSDGWLQRLVEGMPSGPIEELLHAVRLTVFARDESGGQDAGYGLETEAAGLDGAIIERAEAAEVALAALRGPLIRLGMRLEVLLADPPDWLDAQGRARIEGATKSASTRIDLIAAWEAMLARLGGVGDPQYVDWMAVDRADAREYDIGLYRRWLDPMRPFAATVLAPAHGVMMTSATLRDRGGRDPAAHARHSAVDDGWDSAIARSGAGHLDIAPHLAAFESPFDYATQAEVLIVTDVTKGDMAALAHAYARLIEAARGGVLGLFTAIRRLRAVHGRIADRMARLGLPLYAQHVDPVDTGTLVDIFRDDPHASLLGTDALRDGVDVPGQSLRLVVMEQVPWPKPSILHRARRMANPAGGQAHDDAIIRARLAQGFGRLIRSSRDRGHFVVLSPAFPSRLLSAFPAGTPILRLTLDEALHRVAGGVSEPAHTPHPSGRITQGPA